MIKKGFPLLIITILVFSTTGCSIFYRASCPQAETTETDWVPIGSKDSRVYRFQYGNVSVFMWSDVSLEHRFSLVGLPFFPFIPLGPFSPSNKHENFCLNVRIMSRSDTTAIDLSKVRVHLSAEDSLQPIVIKDRHFSMVPKGKMVIYNEENVYKLEFEDIWEAQRFYVDLGNIQISDKDVKLPLLRYRKAYRYFYKPFFT